MDIPTFLKFSHYLLTCLYGWNRQSVLKRRHTKFRRQGITQKKTYYEEFIVCATHQLLIVVRHNLIKDDQLDIKFSHFVRDKNVLKRS
jgi:hypothetical protein